MNILINRKLLKKSLQDVVGVVGKDLTMPILSHVLIQKSSLVILELVLDQKTSLLI